MTRAIRAALATACALAVVAPTQAPAKGFEQGVAAGEVTATTAMVWTRADRSGAVTVRYGAKKNRLNRSLTLTARKRRDFTVQDRLTNLKPDTRYWYRFRQGSHRSELGSFRTAPRPTSAKPIRFAWSGDSDATAPQPGAAPFYNLFQVHGLMARAGNHFNIHLGDTIYSDTEVPGAKGPALTVSQKWAKYRETLSLPNLRDLRATTGLYSHWDDHEFINDFNKAEYGSIYDSGVRAFRDYQPVRYSRTNGLYRSFRWGRNLEVFFLDERSFRSLRATVNHVCDNPQTKAPDVAPTLPSNKRALFQVLVPSLAEPVNPLCLQAINDPERSMLGQRQFDRFTKAVKASKAAFKIVVNEVPIQQAYALPYDRWEGYEAERDRLLTFLRDNVKNVVFLSTDNHANWVNDARLQTFEEGGAQNTGLIEITTGPVAAKTESKQLDEITGRAGGGEVFADAFYKPAPPDGLGMSCSSNDVYSYGQVVVTSKALTIHLADLNGNPVVDATGASCAPITIAKQ